MNQVEVLQEVQRMPLVEKLDMVEAALRMIRLELPVQPAVAPTREERRRRLAESAQIAAPWYLEDKELTIFTDLNVEDIMDYE